MATREETIAAIKAKLAGSRPSEAPFQDETRELRNELDNTRRALGAAEEKYQTVAAEYELLKMRAAELAQRPRDERLSDLTEERRRLEVANEDLRKQRDEIMRMKEFELKSMDILKREVGRWMRERVKASTEGEAEIITMMREEIERLRNGTAATGPASDPRESDQLRDRIAKLQRELDARAEKIEALSREQASGAGEAALRRVKELEEALAAEKKKAPAVEIRPDPGMLAELNNLRAEVEKLRRERDAGMESQPDAELLAELDDFRTKVAKLQSQLDAATDVQPDAELLAELDELRREVATLRSDRDAAMEIQPDAELLAELDDLRTKVAKLQNQLDAATDVQPDAELLAELDELRREVATLRSERDAAMEIQPDPGLLAELDSLRAEVAKLRSDRESAAEAESRAIEELKNVEQERDGAIKARLQAEQRAEDAERNASEKFDAELEDMRGELSAALGEIERMRREHRRAKEMESETEAEIAKIEADVQKMESQFVEPRRPEPARPVAPFEPAAPARPAEPESPGSIEAREKERVELLIKKAYSYEDDGSAQQAVDAYMEVLSIDPVHLKAIHNLALLKYRSGDIESAAELLGRIENSSQDVPSETKKLIAEVRRHKPSGALGWKRFFG